MKRDNQASIRGRAQLFLHSQGWAMIYLHSLGRASRYYSARTALSPVGVRLSFSELETRVKGIAAALTAHGFKAGDRLALLLPNSPEYIELVYACAWLGVIAVPLNTRLSAVEIDRVLTDATPRGLIRHSSLPVSTTRISWEKVLDQDPLEIQSDLPTQVAYDPEAILALIYTSGTTGQPKGVMVTHANVLADIHRRGKRDFSPASGPLVAQYQDASSCKTE